jgi:homospermidine synthase
MDAQLNGMQTHGRKGFTYDWQSLLVPAEPEFSEQLDELISDDSVSAELGS